jgi:hypothetical protein
MKYKLSTAVCVLAISLTTVTPSLADETRPTAATMIVDTVIARPACLVATVLGSAFFVLSLPWAACSHKIQAAADLLVVRPAQATFTRPLGEMPSLADDE